MGGIVKAISLGWGVQSWVLAAMAALGDLEPVDVAIHSDTTHERSSTYEFAAQWTPWLEERGVRVVTVTNDDSTGTDVLPVRPSGGGEISIPAYTVRDGKRGTVRRQCTGHWKINPVRRWLQAHRNRQPVELWLGITTDEWQRAKDADVRYITHRFPLLDLGMSRADCLRWLRDHDLPTPGKSSCVFCPYLNKRAWEEMKREGGDDWRKAVQVDASIRDARLPGQLFVHGRCLPLDQAVRIPEDSGYSQLDMLASDDAAASCDSGFCFL
jgi:hypothetical protein